MYQLSIVTLEINLKLSGLKQPPFTIAHKAVDQMKGSVDVPQAQIAARLPHEFVVSSRSSRVGWSGMASPGIFQVSRPSLFPW